MVCTHIVPVRRVSMSWPCVGLLAVTLFCALGCSGHAQPPHTRPPPTQAARDAPSIQRPAVCVYTPALVSLAGAARWHDPSSPPLSSNADPLAGFPPLVPAPSPPLRDIISEAFFFMADPFYTQALAVELSEDGQYSESKLIRNIDKKAKLIQHAASLYDAASTFNKQNPKWTILSRYRIGAMQQDIATQIFNAPPYPGLHKPEFTYIDILEAAAFKLEDNAVQNFVLTLQRAEESKIFNEHTEDARRRLYLLRPDLTHSNEVAGGPPLAYPFPAPDLSPTTPQANAPQQPTHLAADPAASAFAHYTQALSLLTPTASATDATQAQAHLQHAILANPQNPLPYYALAFSYLNLGQPDASARIHQHLSAQHFDPALLDELSAWIAHAEGDLNAAFHRFQAAADKHPHSLSLQRNAASIAISLSQYKAARLPALRALSLCPLDQQAKLALGISWMGEDNNLAETIFLEVADFDQFPLNDENKAANINLLQTTFAAMFYLNILEHEYKKNWRVALTLWEIHLKNCEISARLGCIPEPKLTRKEQQSLDDARQCSPEHQAAIRTRIKNLESTIQKQKREQAKMRWQNGYDPWRLSYDPDAE